MTVAVWFLYEFGDIVDCCWVTFADCHFFTQLFFLFMGGIGEFFEIRIFYPVKLSDSRLSFGVFFEIRKIPQTSLLYTYFYWGEKVKQKEFPQHTSFTSYTDTRNTPHNIAA